MEITNFKYISPTKVEYNLSGIIEYYTNSGYAFTKLTEINGKKEDSLALRQVIKHEDILNYITNLNNIKC